MNKLIISLAITLTLPLSPVAVAQETDITETFLDSEITELQLQVCNNSEVASILSSNEAYKTALDDALEKQPDSNYFVLTNPAKIGSFDDDDNDDDGYEDDDDDGDGIYTTKTFSSTSIDRSIMADPADPSPQDELTTNVCP